ncbi:putative transcriptional regulatory protein [Posidoniimonas polymericola]|uniref:Probable transcriptional regulatory protein Pla123a_41290 n=1 Tax=Posidoniimonas polymericola TaxID=2528002 RepID=A0A5C5YD11_9BACT|nr:YebC/PmpR family DNA-binding transcriptional regulator [Posidoniimonas polymericola]TWT72829.1 putative transcriptional regulatory protein [Posidoniimonas polymericola]
MAGHSHWAGIKHKKAAIDAKRGKVWSKLSKAIIVAAKMGGADPDANLRLRYAINDAKAVSMPKDNIERAIKKGAGDSDGDNYEEIIYEGMGPSGVAFMCEILTDNRNRTAPEIRKIFEVCGGKLGATGCAAWMFERKGLLIIPASETDEESLMELALEAGADDVKHEGENFEVTCPIDAYNDVTAAVEAAELATESSEITYLPNDYVEVPREDAGKILKLMERLDDHDDVQKVSANFSIDESIMAELEE